MIEAARSLGASHLRRADMAAMLPIAPGLSVMICIVIMQWIEKKDGDSSGAKTPAPIQRARISNPIVNYFVHGAAYLIVFLKALPAFPIILFSFASVKSIMSEVIPTALSIRNYINVLTGGAALIPLMNSLVMGCIAAGGALIVSLFVVTLAHRYNNKPTTALDLTFMAPWILPAPFIAIGLIVAFATPRILPGGRTLLGSFWIFPIGYGIIIIP